MNKIVFPLKIQMQGAEVGDLQTVLQQLLARALVLRDDEDARALLATGLQHEHPNQKYGRVTAKLVSLFQLERGLEATGRVDASTAAALNTFIDECEKRGDEPPPVTTPTYVVKGTVSWGDESPAEGIKMSAYDRDLRSEERLGQSQKTDIRGTYRIAYTADEFRKREKHSADLVVRASSEDGSLLAESPVLFNAPPAAEVNLVIPATVRKAPPLFDRIDTAVECLRECLDVAELEENEEHQDVSFLSGETGFSTTDIARFVLAHKLAAEDIQPEFWFVLLGASFYRFTSGQALKDQLSAVLDKLPSLDEAAVRKSLTRGFNECEIDECLREKEESWIKVIFEFVASRTVRDSDQPTLVRHVLEDALIVSAKKQEKFARLYNEHRGFTQEVSEALNKDRSFTKTEVADLSTSFQLTDIVQGDFSVVKAVKEEFGVRKPDEIRSLAKKSEDEWVRFAKEKHAAGAIVLPFEITGISERTKTQEAEVYGRSLERGFREAFPTTAFSGGLERAMERGGVSGLRRGESLNKFLGAHREFEFLNTPVDDFLGKGIDPEFNTLAEDDDFRLELKAVQRVFKLAPTFEATDALLADNVHSAQQMYRMGETEFVGHYSARPGFTRDSARLTWNRAADTLAAVVSVVAELKALDDESMPMALKSGSQALSDFPTWKNLFKTGDLCECEHCRSVLGPAAYFADLLMFLKDRKAANPANTVKDILFARRPDLGYLELNCANALTTLPYIDVVCEVLEDVVAAGENDLELPGLTIVPSDPVAAKTAVKTAFDGQDISLGEDFSLSQVDPGDPDRWVVHGDEIAYLLKKKATPNFFAEILRNTKASAAELRAYPQYVNPKAYDRLREAKFPSTLPFDLFAEDVRAAFQKTNLKRWDLMRTFKGSAAPNNASDGEVGAEYFDISSDASAPFDEMRLTLVADTSVAGQQAVWGETGNAAWLDAVGKVRNFLDKTGLEYDDLLKLLDLSYINPGDDIVVHHLDSSCDLDKKIIQVLTAEKLDRIHRFLRLHRKLKEWQLWELDLVIRHPAIGKGEMDEAFLIQLFHLCRLKKRLGKKTSVEHLCALLGDLNTKTRFTELHEKREDSLYHDLFLDRKLIKPLDPAFVPDETTGDLPVGNTISAHRTVLLAALRIRESDLDLLQELTKASDGTAYTNDDLTLANLSFIWRHSWLARMLKLKAADWKVLLKVFNQDMFDFTDAMTAWEFVETVDRIKQFGFKPDELNWLLTADRTARAAVKETDTARFLGAMRKELQDIDAGYDPAQYDFLTALPATDTDSLTDLLTGLLQKLNRDEAAVQYFVNILNDEVTQQMAVTGIPSGFDFPQPITDSIRVRYDEPSTTLRFAGLMTATERTTLLTDASLSAVTGIPAYQKAIDELFSQPRLALKFFEPVFTAPLENLPAAVDFKNLADGSLAQRIAYDAQQRVLRVTGVLSGHEQVALEALSADADYQNAIASLAAQPQSIAPPDERIWLLDADLQFPLRDLAVPVNDNLAQNLATAATKALVYLSKTLSERAVVQQGSAQLGISEALTRQLMTQYGVLPDTVMTHLTGGFVATHGVIDYATLKTTFDGWYWASRVAAIWNRWKVTPAELEKLAALMAGAQLFDVMTLPLDDTGASASLEHLVRTSLLLRVRDTLPETDATLLEVLEKLSTGGYGTAAAFAADVQLLNDDWAASDVEAVIDSVDLTYPGDYLLAESWQRLRRAFYFVDNLNASVDTVKEFAAATMGMAHARAIKELLRSRFGTETWLTLSAEIQDVLRDRKRDALAAYLLTQPQPADAPSGKWENTNDLYAYYLLDVEMTSCQLTSRLVQGSGSVQLFVQRCFMGLEPDVEVIASGDDGDSAWRWWKWMSKYRPWEANRKVFLWPENWVEPELKKDRSEFFKQLENEMVQNEINQHNVEKAFTSYLERLDGVAQLEIAGFYQEDDADLTIVHVFGRTMGVEPRQHYYRRYDYRQWTPWEKVEVDIKGDYLIPAVVNGRLFLFWPVFTEIPDETENSKPVPLPAADASQAPVEKTKKKLRLQLAVTDYRQNKWTPMKVSKDFYESQTYEEEIVKKHYEFYPIDRSEIDGRFGVKFRGHSLGRDGNSHAGLHGAFEVAGCKGVPEAGGIPGTFEHAIRPEWDSTDFDTHYLKWKEMGRPNEFGYSQLRHDDPQQDFTLSNSFSPVSNQPLHTPVLMQTPGIFEMSPPWHLSYMDRLWLDGQAVLGKVFSMERIAPLGSWLPYFYNDDKRTFFVLPTLGGGRKPRTHGGPDSSSRNYYPDIKQVIRQLKDYFEGPVRTWVDAIDLASLTAAQRQVLEQFLKQQLPLVAPPLRNTPPSYTDDQVRDLMTRFVMRFYNFYLGYLSLALYQFRQFHFKNFYHPFACDFAKLVYNPLKGIPALMSRETQLKDTGFSFDQSYQPTFWVVEPGTEIYYPNETVDFTPDGAYSSYNWELFFHAPLLIANQLSKNQRFEEAREWYHFIFNPIGIESAMPGGSVMSKYWITKPFFETTDSQYVQQRVNNIMRMLAGDTNVPEYSDQAKKDLEAQVLDWRRNPYEPHRIANYRTAAYQKTVVMKYLDNLIEWGDYLFRLDSMESINEATQLYVLAAEILGPRPRKVPPQAKPPVESFSELEQEFDKFSNALIEVENLIPPSMGNRSNGGDQAPLPMLYFCIPHNEKLIGYWDTVADRLFKIRHCMNIEGVVRQLALFEPPIDPGLLVKAVAGGLDIGSVLADLNAPLPLYRFNVLLQTANAVCNDVKALGSALLRALEKKDTEELALLRQGQEIRVLESVKSIRETQIEESQRSLDAAEESRELAKIKRKYYRDLEYMNTGEMLAMGLSAASTTIDAAVALAYILSGGLRVVPQFLIGAAGFGGSPQAGTETGGNTFGAIAEDAALTLTTISRALEKGATIASTVASYDRRQEDWDFQKDLADQEIVQVDEEIAGAGLRVDIAQKELDNHIKQIDDAKAVADFMHSKYTGKELIQWEIGQISNVYFQSYKLAYDLAKRAERCFRFELGLQDSSYINFGYWDSLKKGLLAGENLQYDLRRLESAYLERNRRELELTKHISLALLDPLALVKLRETGRCFVSLPEEIFDLDYPGHYFRRIKSISLTLPCITGPYTTVSCTMRLLKNSIRINTTNGDNGYPRNTDDDGFPVEDTRFIQNNTPTKVTAASSAQNDSGVFELNFRDERFLPFEKAGVISDLSLELFNDLPSNNPDSGNPDFGRPLRQFDYGTISDVILHVKYTAHEDAGTFKNGVITHLRDYFEQDESAHSLRMFNLKNEFPTQWHRFLHPGDPADGNVFDLEMSTDLFPIRDQGKTLKVNTIWLLARCTDSGSYDVVMTPPLPEPPPPAVNELTLAPLNQYGGLHFSQKDTSVLAVEIEPNVPAVTWQLKMTRPGGGNLEIDSTTQTMEVEDLVLVLGYEWE